MLNKIQDIFAKKRQEVDLSEYTRDSVLMIYLANLLRTVTKADDLVENRIDLKRKEREKEKEKEEKERKEKEKKENEDKLKLAKESNEMKD